MRHFEIGLMGLLLAVSAPAMADDDYSAVEESIRALAPQATSIAISETPIEGILMVQVSGDIVYATADGKFLIQGRVIDLETREDLTEGAKSELRKELMSDIDMTQQIVFTPEEPAYELTVFTDIDCGYCRKLHQEIQEIMGLGIEVQYLFFPRSGPGTVSWSKEGNVWCAPDRNQALTTAKAGGDVPARKCENTPVQAHYDLGQRVGVRGTPAIYSESGVQLGGYLPAEALLGRLEALKD